jgi:hypothetical protein
MSAQPKSSAPRHRFRPQLEALEDRLVPVTAVVPGNAYFSNLFNAPLIAQQHNTTSPTANLPGLTVLLTQNRWEVDGQPAITGMQVFVHGLPVGTFGELRIFRDGVLEWTQLRPDAIFKPGFGIFRMISLASPIVDPLPFAATTKDVLPKSPTDVHALMHINAVNIDIDPFLINPLDADSHRLVLRATASSPTLFAPNFTISFLPTQQVGGVFADISYRLYALQSFTVARINQNPANPPDFRLVTALDFLPRLTFRQPSPTTIGIRSAAVSGLLFGHRMVWANWNAAHAVYARGQFIVQADYTLSSFAPTNFFV